MSTLNPLVTVIIPTYNYAQGVMASVASALGQTERNIELIIVNDASTDTTFQVLEKIADPRVHVITHARNHGVCVAYNTAIDVARGAYIALLDHDDLWSHDKLTKQLAHMEAHPDHPLCLTEHVWQENGQLNSELFPLVMHDLEEAIITGKPVGFGTTAMAPRHIFQEIRFDPNAQGADDWDFLLRATQRKVGITIVPESLAIYTGGHTPAEMLGTGRNYILRKYSDGSLFGKKVAATVHIKSAYVDIVGKRYLSAIWEMGQAATISPAMAWQSVSTKITRKFFAPLPETVSVKPRRARAGAFSLR